MPRIATCIKLLCAFNTRFELLHTSNCCLKSLCTFAAYLGLQHALNRYVPQITTCLESLYAFTTYLKLLRTLNRYMPRIGVFGLLQGLNFVICLKFLQVQISTAAFGLNKCTIQHLFLSSFPPNPKVFLGNGTMLENAIGAQHCRIGYPNAPRGNPFGSKNALIYAAQRGGVGFSGVWCGDSRGSPLGNLFLVVILVVGL